MSGARLLRSADLSDQVQAGGRAIVNEAGRHGTTATIDTQTAPQSATVILLGAQPLQGPGSTSDAIPVMDMPGEAIDMIPI